MKRCPECRRDYYDDSLLYCLDDGSGLLEGPAPAGERTAVRPAFSEAATAIVKDIRPETGVSHDSIAVLPFANVSADPENDYFCDGLAEELLNALARIEGLKVAARTSAFSFKGKNIDVSEIAKALRVSTILEGSVRRSGNRLRITAQLVNAADGYHLWSELFDRELQDIFEVQEQITLAIVDSLRLKLFGDRRTAVLRRYTQNTEAYQQYLRGRFYWNKRSSAGYEQAIECFERAIALDPDYALAFSGIADCYNSSGFSFDVGSLPVGELVSKAKAAALRALEIDDTLAEAHTSLAYAKHLFDWDWAGAESGFRRAIDLNPNYANAHHWYSHYLTAHSRMDESLVHSKLALELDPLSVVMQTHLGWHHLYAREYDPAIEQLKNALTTDPEFLHAHWYLALAYEMNGLYKEAEAEFHEAIIPADDTLTIEADLAHFYGVSGQKDKARKTIDRLEKRAEKRHVSSFGMALAHLGLGETDRAFYYLEKALGERSDMLVYLKAEPRLDPLRDDPRFDRLAKDVGLAP